MRIWGKFALVYLLHGKGRYRDARGMNLALRPGDLIAVFPDLAHTYRPEPGHRWDEYYIVFNGPVFATWQATGALGVQRPIYHLEPLDYWLRRLVTAAGESTGGDLVAGLTGACRVQQLLADILTADEPGEADRAWLNRAKAILDETVTTTGSTGDADVTIVADRLGMNYATFRKRFARLAGVGPSHYRAARVMDRACDLLIDPTATLRQIAQTCGFCDEFHFSKRFKQLVGVSPTDFRQRLPTSG
jgi:AraC-like DNA-binding protein